jgi:hypothetical protein
MPVHVHEQIGLRKDPTYTREAVSLPPVVEARPSWCPARCGMNLRRVLLQTQWRKIRQGLIAEHGLKCQTCGKVETETSRIYAHEEWEYETKRSSGVARLVGLKLRWDIYDGRAASAACYPR